MKLKERIRNSRLLLTAALTFFLFVIGLVDYLISKSFEIGYYSLPIAFVLVWFLLFTTKIDKLIFK